MHLRCDSLLFRFAILSSIFDLFFAIFTLCFRFSFHDLIVIICQIKAYLIQYLFVKQATFDSVLIQYFFDYKHVCKQLDSIMNIAIKVIVYRLHVDKTA